MMQAGQKSPDGRYQSLTHQVIRDKDAFKVSEMDVCYGYIVYGYKELHPLGLALFP